VLFNNILAGSYTIQASKAGYVFATSSIDVVVGTTAEVNLTLAAIPATSDLRVTVKEKDGAPIAAVSVSSTTQPSGQPPLSGTTGVDGARATVGAKIAQHTQVGGDGAHPPTPSRYMPRGRARRTCRDDP